jgi:hypothetical protein
MKLMSCHPSSYGLINYIMYRNPPALMTDFPCTHAQWYNTSCFEMGLDVLYGSLVFEAFTSFKLYLGLPMGFTSRFNIQSGLP